MNHESINLDLMRKFCAADRPEYAEPFNTYSAFDCGDVIATNGQVVLCVPKARHPDLKEGRHGIPAKVLWALDAVAKKEPEVGPAKKSAIARIPEYVTKQLEIIPGIEFVNVPKVRICVSGRTTRWRWDKVDQNGVVYFRYDGGVGCCVAEKLNC